MQTAGLIDPDRAAALLEARDPALFAERLLEEGIYAIGFFFPVVAQGHVHGPHCNHDH